ncbi:MAG: glutamate-1-semialdehyde 2,1-aminomutase [Lachnospiraceae bacterium]|nr:glutamate-1-semialdehyde 2,1-aminomutase [Lachnospiraceae bacterium]MDY5742035.1 glutamate-1-semialdehyde 2,1-aminomutase [Lachnospiraceae bacterium]
MTRAEQIRAACARVMPGGVNSPVRAFRQVGLEMPIMERGEGSEIIDIEGRRFTDFVCSWGPLILGHADADVLAAVTETAAKGLTFGAATELEYEMATLLIDLIPGMDMVRMVNSGTEATMSAIRLARGVTGRNKIIKFEGCYHGHSDALLVSAGSGLMTQKKADSAGVPASYLSETIQLPFHDIGAVERAFAVYGQQIAAVILEPVPANMGVLTVNPTYLRFLREITKQNGSLLIFDEVITGFRLGLTGAIGFFDIQPDIVCYGKIIGGGMPVGAYAGGRELMEQVAPLGAVYQAGTLSGNPVAMAAGLTQLRKLRDHPEIYQQIDSLSAYLQEQLRQRINEQELPLTVGATGNLFSIFFTPQPVTDYESAKTCDTELFAECYRYLFARGFYFAPSQFEAVFLSVKHTREQVERFLEVFDAFWKEYRR